MPESPASSSETSAPNDKAPIAGEDRSAEATTVGHRRKVRYPGIPQRPRRRPEPTSVRIAWEVLGTFYILLLAGSGGLLGFALAGYTGNEVFIPLFIVLGVMLALFTMGRVLGYLLG